MGFMGTARLRTRIADCRSGAHFKEAFVSRLSLLPTSFSRPREIFAKYDHKKYQRCLSINFQ